MKEITLGGQAVIEGVLMRTRTHYAVAVRNHKKRIVVRKERVSTASGSKLLKLPFIRGVIALYETLVLGFKALLYSASVSAGKDERLSKKEIAVAMTVAVFFAIGVFIALPFFLASLVTRDNLAFNLIDGLLRLAALLGYLAFISLFNDVRRIFQYHGAEHMTIHAYEKKKKLTYRNVVRYRTMHPRCGTSFLLIVVILSILVFSAITSDNFAVKFLSRILLIPVIAGSSYEILKFTAKHQNNPLVRPFILPGIWLQYLTTRRPDKSQIEVAVASLNALVRKKA